MTTPAPTPACVVCPPFECASLATCSVGALADVDVTTDPPAPGDVLTWNGTAWAPAPPA